MKLRIYSIVVLLLLSCKRETQVLQHGSYNSTTREFNSARINWKITVPDTWQITAIDTIKSQLERGLDKAELKKADNQVKNDANISYLIAFNKNSRNSFTAFLDETPYDKANFEQIIRNSKNAILEQLEKQGIKADTIWSKKRISGVDFDVFDLLIDIPNTENDFHQHYYNAFINDKYLSILIGYDNSDDKTQLLKTLNTSTFIK